jgi:hypothetical protein
MGTILKIFAAVAVLVGLLLTLVSAEVIGFRRVVVINDQPIPSGVQITAIDKSVFTLSDGSRYLIDLSKIREDGKERLSVGDTVRMEEVHPGYFRVHALVNGWLCGTGWSQPIIIPIIRDTAYKNRIKVITTASRKASATGVSPDVVEVKP